ncbi:MAG: hypothetical protein YSLV7_ORF10 [Yellowstone Lake virophage 7]|uniref:hypothetical protein n=1 Tax=Yellowstone Lake virophage 7 TaxID=1557035 RepID=UPI0005360092|nr:MAG: hypothetical protein ASQ67_gp10 [Yellowstone Lake virophage 7]AIW01929.1 MAG: hypothetical protein YSLV7_ORF10 [Yellowstone Lake virophage 7]
MPQEVEDLIFEFLGNDYNFINLYNKRKYKDNKLPHLYINFLNSKLSFNLCKDWNNKILIHLLKKLLNDREENIKNYTYNEIQEYMNLPLYNWLYGFKEHRDELERVGRELHYSTFGHDGEYEPFRTFKYNLHNKFYVVIKCKINTPKWAKDLCYEPINIFIRDYKFFKIEIY